MAVTITIEQHRRDYSGTLKRPAATHTVETEYPEGIEVDIAKAWVMVWFQRNDSAMRYAVIEGDEGTYLCSPTDGPSDNQDWW